MNEQEIKEYSEKLWHIHLSISDFYSGYAKSFGFTLQEFKIINILYKEINPTQKLITNLTHLPKQTVNTIIKSFLKKGLIKEPITSDTDKRNKIINFTEEGRKIADSIISKAGIIESRAIKSMGDKRAQALIEAILIYKKNLKTE